MRVLILSTQSRISREWLTDQLAPLRQHDPVVEVVALAPPADRLPVERFFVAGRSVRPRRRVGSARTAGSKKARPYIRTRTDRALDRVVPDRWAKDNALRLLTGVLWSSEVRVAFAAADLVVATDAKATWAAWHLARRIPRPPVVYGTAGALRALSAAADGR
jgi:hypothetical protein